MGKLKEIKECINCKKEFKAWSSSAGKYCKTECQQEFQRKEKVKTWLKTGNCVPGSSRTHYVRLYLYEEQMNSCAICGNENRWNGKEINFILDHVDGDSLNNKRENLRLICPNCDSQLDTYKSRNKGNGRHSRRQRYKEGKSY